MKKEYNKPSVEIVEFVIEDTITTYEGNLGTGSGYDFGEEED